MVTIGKTVRKRVSANRFLLFGLLTYACSCYSLYLAGLAMGETYVEMEEDTYNPNILDTIKWSMVSHPEGWDKMTYHQMRQHFKCSAHGNDQTKPLPTLDEWNTLRQNYKDVVDPHSTFDEAVPPTEGYNYDGLGNPPPYYPKHSKGKGRGLFANRFIKKGELVDDGNKHAVIFPNATSFRKYTFSLPRKLACDIVEWPWTQILHKGGPLKTPVLLGRCSLPVLMRSTLTYHDRRKIDILEKHF